MNRRKNCFSSWLTNAYNPTLNFYPVFVQYTCKQVNILHGHLGVKSWVQMRGYSSPHPTAPGAAQTARFIHSLSPCPITPHNLTSQLSLILQWRTRGSRKANIQLVRVRARFCKRTRDPPPYTHSCSNERRINVPSFNSSSWTFAAILLWTAHIRSWNLI